MGDAGFGRLRVKRVVRRVDCWGPWVVASVRIVRETVGTADCSFPCCERSSQEDPARQGRDSVKIRLFIRRLREFAAFPSRGSYNADAVIFCIVTL